HSSFIAALQSTRFSRMVETNDEWIVTRTGIRERRVNAPDEGTSPLRAPASSLALVIAPDDGMSHFATRATAEALHDAGIAPGELDLIIGATTPADRERNEIETSS